MFDKFDWQWLQLFGEDADADTGEEEADAGQERLRELGVPEEKIHRAKLEKEAPQAAAAKERRMSWQEILKDPEYNAQIQKIVRSRVKDQGQSRAILQTLSPALRQLAETHGLDPENIDHEALAEKITGQRPDPRVREQRKFRGHMESLRQQEEALREVVPDFQLRQELRNPLFARLTSPGVGLSVEDAFYTVHRKEMQQRSMQVAAQQTRQLISNAIQSGTHRPEEAGTQAATLTRFDYRTASPDQRMALKKEIRKAAAEGRKVYPG